MGSPAPPQSYGSRNYDNVLQSSELHWHTETMGHAPFLFTFSASFVSKDSVKILSMKEGRKVGARTSKHFVTPFCKHQFCQMT